MSAAATFARRAAGWAVAGLAVGNTLASALQIVLFVRYSGETAAVPAPTR